MTIYTNLAQIKRTINTGVETENETLLENADTISVRIDEEMASEFPFFVPYRLTDEAIQITRSMVNSSSNTLRLPQYWLEIDAITQSGQARAYGTDVIAYPSGASPVRELRLAEWCNSWYDSDCDGCDTDPLTTVLSGVIGYRRRSRTRWVKAGTLTTAVDGETTTLAITKAGGGALPPESTILSAGHLVRIDDEYMNKAYNAASHIVERGVNGTTGSGHDADKDVWVWQVEEPIRRVVARQSGLMLSRRGAYDTRGSNEIGTPIVYPQDLLLELLAVLQEYATL